MHNFDSMICFLADHVIMSGCAGGLVAISNLKSGLVIRLITDHKGAPITDLQAAPKPIQVSEHEGGSHTSLTGSQTMGPKPVRYFPEVPCTHCPFYCAVALIGGEAVSAVAGGQWGSPSQLVEC